MSVSDGSVGGITKVVDHGPPSMRWNLVILGDGYQASEMAKFHTDVENFLDDMYQVPPYDELWCGINVYRIDVTSTDSGADDPTTCGGTGATPRTYYDATFCSPWNGTRLERLLTVDSARAKADALAKLPETDQVLVIVNSSKYGGAGGQVATCSTNAQASEIAIHEIGHSAFGLADEYEDGGTAGGGEPFEPNVTVNTNRATLKWGALVAASTPIPSSCYGDCAAGCTPPATPPAAGAIGTYEGGRYMHCGMYRPLPNCYMRDYSPFCGVCAGVIQQTLAPFLPAEVITLLTPSIAFTDIPEGVGATGITTFRAILFEVETCRTLNFRITSGPTGGFGTPFGSGPVQANPGRYSSTDTARLWLSYTSTTAGASAMGSVVVRCDETGQTWTINLIANTVPRPRSAVALVLDRSGSMIEDAGSGTTKVQNLRESVGVFLSAMLPGDAVGVVRFDHTVQRLMDIADVGPVTGGPGTGRDMATGIVNSSQLDPAGATAIGGGVAEGKATLDAGQAAGPTPYNVLAMVVLSDGVENTAPMLSDVTASISARTFAIGLGLPYNISVAALNALTQGNNGYLLVTGALTTDQRTRLTKYFLQVLAGINNANIVVDPDGWLAPGVEHRVPFALSETDYAFEGFVLSPVPQAIEYELESPDGTRITPADVGAVATGSHLLRPGLAMYRMALPSIPARAGGSHGGTWHAILRFAKPGAGWLDARLAHLPAATAAARGVVPYDFLVHCYSNLLFDAQLVQGGYEPGARVDVFASLKEYDVPVGSRATVWAEVQRPDKATTHVALALNDVEQYEGRFHTSLPGVYAVRVRASGQTYRGTAFRREKTLSAVAVPGGGIRPTPSDPLRELLCCLLHSEGSDALWKRLAAQGVDIRHLRECLKRVCSAPAERQRGGSGAKSEALLADRNIDYLVELLQARLKPD